MIRLLPLLLALTGCGPLMPTYSDPSLRNIHPGDHEVHYIWRLVETQEEATRLCNHGIAGGEDAACIFSRADPLPIIVTHMPKDANDWPPLCNLGHEATHVPFGRWHSAEAPY